MNAMVRAVWIGLVAGGVWAAGASAAGKVFDVADYGADASGKALCTGAIQKAIDACAAGGGGTVRFPKGTYRSGAVRLRSGVTLLLEKGAAIRGSRELKDYYLPPVGDAKGKPAFCHLISGEGLRDVAIRGAGTIDGSGSAFRDKSKPRAKCVYLVNCRNVLVEGVRLRNAGSWMQHYRLCRGLTIRNIDVFNHVAFNNDGLNVDSCRDVTITGLPGHPAEDVVLENVRLGFDGGGERTDADRQVGEKARSYPESTMFGVLPAYGLYCRHVRGLTFRKLALTTDKADLRHAMVFEDAEQVVIDALDAPLSDGAAAILRMKDVRKVTLRGRLPKVAAKRLMQVEGKGADQIKVEARDVLEAGAAPERQP